MSLLISIQGSEGSFNEEALEKYVQENNIADYTVDYALSSDAVLKKVYNQESDLGIFAIYNSNSGLVQESIDAMGKHLFEAECTIELKIRQCLHVKPGITVDKIKRIISHPQALAQSNEYLNSYFPRAEIKQGRDTAHEVKLLMTGTYDDMETAVIAPKICQDKYGSKVLVDDVQNTKVDNTTTFLVVKNKGERGN